MFTLKDFTLRIYAGWIEEHIPEDEILGNCTIWARVMREAFPELIHVGGYVQKAPAAMPTDPFWAEDIAMWSKICLGSRRLHYHEYLRTPDGDVVDPTWKQFGDGYDYIECEEHLIV